MNPALAAALPSLISSGSLLAGGLLSKNKGDAGAEFLNRAYNEFDQLDAPTAEELQYQLRELQIQGIITPEQAEAIMQDPSLLSNITGNQDAIGAQMKALTQLQEIGDQGGMTMGDKATMAEINAENAALERGSREAIRMNAQERGVSGSGLELASQLINQQEAAGRGHQAGLDVAAMAQDRALQAIMQSGELGGKIQTREFEEERAKAEAQDAINKFNTANKQNVALTNTAATNSAQATNLAEKQRIADTNVSLANEKARADVAARQAAFDNLLKKSAGKTGQLNLMAQGARTAADRDAAFQGQAIGAGSQILATGVSSAMAAAKAEEEKKKAQKNKGVV